MRLVVCNSYEEMCREAAKIVVAQVNLKPNCVLGLPTGSTPVGMYKRLAELNSAGEVDFKDVTTFNLDEYYPIDPKNDQSYRYFMNKNLFENINIPMESTHVLNGSAPDADAECDNYEAMIEAAGGIDLQVLGIGQNGHIGFNEPDSFLYSRTHRTGLTENTIQANSRFFASAADVPTESLTMGIGTIIKAKKIILLANGKAKHKVLRELLEGEITTSNPATMLKVHADVTVFCDKEAYEG